MERNYCRIYFSILLLLLHFLFFIFLYFFFYFGARNTRRSSFNVQGGPVPPPPNPIITIYKNQHLWSAVFKNFFSITAQFLYHTTTTFSSPQILPKYIYSFDFIWFLHASFSIKTQMHKISPQHHKNPGSKFVRTIIVYSMCDIFDEWWYVYVWYVMNDVVNRIMINYKFQNFFNLKYFGNFKKKDFISKFYAN